ncbi:hypothetical protein MVEN_02535900 [Mycena venus]|uniref:Uncharacterized protein n=1 Tax=Mycena venus TaxID=2733690 RepID=A0A8H6U3V3_9AGAR|nr:hypothetical protein MVEN_02535900 [Mycena venus]
MAGPRTDQIYTSTAPGSIRIKIEPSFALAFPTITAIKEEPQSVAIPIPDNSVRLRAINEGGREVFVLLSDSESDSGNDSDVEVTATLTRGASRSSSAAPQAFPDAMAVDDSNDEPDSDLVDSDTHWEDDFTSLVRVGNFRITQKVKVMRIEYIPDLACVYPIFHQPTAIVVDLSDPRHQLINPQTEDLYSGCEASSTKQLLNGKTPAAYAPGLHSKRVKSTIIAKVKRRLFPNGTDAAGVFKFYLDGLTKPLPEQYIHSYITTPDGGICILTCVPYLLKLLDDPGVNAFDDDTTYKRIEGKMNEWELTLFAKIVARAATVVRAYINRASTDFFERIFDELQQVKLAVTGKPMPLKRFVPGGNLEVMNADMDGAQILGICRSVMKHNVPEYSGIPNDTPPEQVAKEFVKICWRHAKEPVHDFKSLVTPAQHAHLLNFAYIASKEELVSFTAFAQGLGVKKIQDWWAHKQMHEWIIPCLVKSQSNIPAEVWDTTPSTTNTNEAQHAWTNSLTGTGRSLAEGLTAAYEVDMTVAQEIELTLSTGSTRARKARESQEVTDATKELEEEIAGELEKRRESNARSKELKEQLQNLKGKGGNKSSRPALLSASSSGRVKSAPGGAGTSAHKLSTQPVPVPAPPAEIPATLSAPPANLTATGTALANVPEFNPEFGSDVWSDMDFDFGMAPSNSVLASDAAGAPSFDFDTLFTPSELANLFGLDSAASAAPDAIRNFTNSIATPFPMSFEDSWLALTPRAEFSSSTQSLTPSVGIYNDGWPVL